MFPNIPREYTQFTSLVLITAGLAVMGSGDSLYGVMCIGLSCWILMISESVLHDKIQKEMSIALEGLRSKQEKEISELIEFLKDSKLASNPLSSTNAACKFLKVIQFPAFVMSPSMGIIQANKSFSKILGYRVGDLDGWPAARINHKVVMSEVGHLVSQKPYHDMTSLWMRYVYFHKNGNYVFGALDINKIPDGSYFVVFHPDSDSVLTQSKLKELMS